MAGTKEIRLKIKSVQNTRKITKAMEMVAASKMKKAQERMRRGRPYAQRLLDITMHAARANTEYKHPLLTRRESVKRVGVVVITTDKGLCGGFNTQIVRASTSQVLFRYTPNSEAGDPKGSATLALSPANFLARVL